MHAYEYTYVNGYKNMCNVLTCKMCIYTLSMYLYNNHTYDSQNN